MLPSKVMPYLPRLAAPLMDSLIVQITTSKGKDFMVILLLFSFLFYLVLA
jgi:hypothetical protein